MKLKNDTFSSLIRTMLGGAALKFISTALNFLTAVILARYLEPKGYGQYTLLITIITFLTIPTTLGLPNLLVRFVSAYIANKQYAFLKGLIFISNYVIIILSICLWIAAYYSATYYEQAFNGDKNIYYVALYLLPILGLNSIHTSTLRGLHEVMLSHISSIFARSLSMFFFIVTIIFYKIDLSVKLALFLNIASALIALSCGLFYLSKKVPHEIFFTKKKYEYHKWVKASVPLLVSGGLLIVNQQVDMLMVGYYLKDKDVGVYQVGVRTSEIVSVLIFAGHSALSPIISHYYYLKKNIELQKVLFKYARMIFIFSFPLILFLFLFGGFFINIVFGGAYIDAEKPMHILLLGQCVNIMLGTAGIFLLMTGHEKVVVANLFLTVVINIILNSLLITKYGLIGAAISTSISMSLSGILLFKYAYTNVGFNCSPFKAVRGKFI